MGEQHANGWRVSRHRLVADATVGVIANPMSGRDIRRLVASASVFPNAEKASMVVLLAAQNSSADELSNQSLPITRGEGAVGEIGRTCSLNADSIRRALQVWDCDAPVLVASSDDHQRVTLKSSTNEIEVVVL
jgi:hypothetical protein